MASAAGSLFARTYAGHTGVDPYTTAVSDVYQDLFDEGIFTGKGLYDVDAFTAALEGRVPENALLSHDLFEGLYARTALVTDVEVVDDYPSSVLAHARRQHRWVRGDWQILWWLLPVRAVAHRPDDAIACRSSPAGRSSTTSGAACCRRRRCSCSCRLDRAAGPRRRCGPPSASGAGAAVPVWPARDARRSAPRQSWASFLRTTLDDLKTAAARFGLQLAFMASEACRAAARDRRHAASVSASRAAACSSGKRRRPARRAAAPSQLARLPPRHDGEPAPGAGDARCSSRSLRPSALPIAAPILALWIAAPWIAFALSRPMPRRRAALSPADRAYLRAVARKTWAYFDTFVGAEDHFLPPDNVQVGAAS